MDQNLSVLYEDNHLLAIHKPSGVLSQGDKSGDLPITEIAKQYLIEKYQKSGDAYLGLPHRLDRPTSGLLLLAKTSKALSRLNRMFQKHQEQKTYWAVVREKPQSGQAFLRSFLKRDHQKNKSFSVKESDQEAKLAELDYHLILSLDHYHLLEISPKTGRHHQIRAQLAEIGCPIKGDLKYGFSRSNPDGSIHLHARCIEFIHPVKKRKIKINCPAPDHDPIWKVCNEKFPLEKFRFEE